MHNKVKYEMEFTFQSSPQLLYQYISTPSGLSEWFVIKSILVERIYTFIWDDAEEQAKLLRKKGDELVKFRWIEAEDDTFF